jgi:NitT/TauT family transport system substrate-binding protein
MREETMMRRRTLLGASIPVALTLMHRARAAETLRLAVGQKGNWDTSVAELGQRAGIFRKHDLELDILYTQGSGETLQAVLSRSAEIGVAGGTLGAMGAFSKGAPVRIIASEATGAGDLFWYVRADSPIRSIKETAGKTVAYSTQGSSTNSVVLGFADTFGIKPELVSTGGIPGTFTQVMSGQIDVGWSAAPYLLDAAEDGRIRIIASGNDVPSMRNQTVRVNVAHAAVLASRMPVVLRFTAGYRETVQWMYGSPDAAKAYAEFAGVQERLVKRLREEFFPHEAIWSDKITGIDSLMTDAVRFKFISAPLSKQQLAELIQIPSA